MMRVKQKTDLDRHPTKLEVPGVQQMYNEGPHPSWMSQDKNWTFLTGNAPVRHHLDHLTLPLSIIAHKTKLIAEKPKAVLECITDASLKDQQKKALKRSYEELLKNAELEAQKIKRESLNQDNYRQRRDSTQRPRGKPNDRPAQSWRTQKQKK
eukprot:Em0003g163a